MTTLKLMQEEYLAEARSHMRTPEGVGSLHEGEFEMFAEWVAATVVGGAWAAMDNYGKGSLMDQNNPALPGYMKSGLWNPYRTGDLAIRSRQAGSYLNIFGEKATSKAASPGFNLEHKGGKYAPQPPSHALETAARWMKAGRAGDIWQGALNKFPWGRFIVVTPD